MVLLVAKWVMSSHAQSLLLLACSFCVHAAHAVRRAE